MMFNNDKNIMIVANIRGTTVEIIDKIKFRRGAYKDTFLRYFPEFKID